MCDTIVALANSTADGSVLFGKNSDREPDEVQNLEIYERSSHPAGSKVRCTHIEVPEVENTNRIFLCRPFWMFGAEMGANEHGVVIGNEALFTREKPDNTGLTGMDMLRLALERASTARAAKDEIIRLLEAHGQGGNCGYRHKIKYMNGFIIADREEAYVLETVRFWWAYKKVEDIWSISNIISLTDDFDDCHSGLIENAIEKRYCRSESEFNFRKCYSDTLFTRFAHGESRECRSRKLLREKKGKLTSRDFMEILRDHGGEPDWRPDRQKKGVVCMHATNPVTRPSESVCSLVSKLGKSDFHYATGSPNPCMSPFFPVFSENADLPSGYEPGAADYDPKSYWWEGARVHRKALWRFRHAIRKISPLLDKYESMMVERIEKGSDELTQETMNNYFREAEEIVEGFSESLSELPEEKPSLLFRLYWQRLNRLNGVPG